MSNDRSPAVALGPAPGPHWLADAIVAGGGRLVPLDQAEALVWADARDADALERALSAEQGVRWVQLPFAGIENFVHLLDRDHVWTCGKGVYAEPVAEMALTLGLAGLRGFGTYARAGAWSPPIGHNLIGGTVTVLGGGGITESLIRLLGPFGVRIRVVRRTPRPMSGVEVVAGPERLHELLAGADLVVIALSLTPETEGIIGAAELASMEPHAWLVNVGRGRHVDTAALVDALRAGEIGGAGLDVTDPEPLPAGHPLWEFPNCLITPHVGNTPAMAVPLLSARVTDNVRRFARGEDLLGGVDVDSGY